MKNLIVYYSHEGSTRYIQKLIAERIDVDVLELKPKKEIPKEGFRKYFWGGKSVVFNEKPVLLNTIPDLDGYDTIIIGTPIWAGTYAAPVNTFIANSHISKKRMAFYACNSGGEAEKFQNSVMIKFCLVLL